MTADDGYNSVIDDDEEEDDDADYVASDEEDDGGQAAAVATRGAARRGMEPTATTADEATLAVLRAELVLLQRMHEGALRSAKEAEAEAKRRRSAAASLAKELEGKQRLLETAQWARGGQRR